MLFGRLAWVRNHDEYDPLMIWGKCEDEAKVRQLFQEIVHSDYRKRFVTNWDPDYYLIFLREETNWCACWTAIQTASNTCKPGRISGDTRSGALFQETGKTPGIGAPFLILTGECDGCLSCGLLSRMHTKR